MAFLTQQQVKEILEKAPANLDRAKLVQTLAQQHTLEGYNDIQKTQKTIGGFAGNIAKSGADLIKNTAQAITNPVETVSSLGKIGAGAVAKAIPGRQGVEQNFDNVTDFYKQRYGSFNQLKETAYNDPIGVAGDVATITGGVGAVAKLGTVSKIGNFSKVANVANKINTFTDPLQAVTAIPKSLIPKRYLSTTAEKLYQSALKPSTTLSDIERAKIISTGLKEGVPVNSFGATKLGKELDGLNKEISNVIKEGREAGDVVKTSSIVNILDDVKKKVGLTINGKSRLDEIAEIEDNFLEQYGKTIPTDVAQEIKKNTYQVLRKSYGEMKSTAIEAEKALARGIKEELVIKYPQLKKLNARDSDLINLDKALERAVSRINNRDIVGLGATVASTANPFAGILKAIIDNPTVKSRIGIAIQKVADKKIKPIRKRKPITPATRLTQPARESKEQK